MLSPPKPFIGSGYFQTTVKMARPACEPRAVWLSVQQTGEGAMHTILKLLAGSGGGLSLPRGSTEGSLQRLRSWVIR